MHGLRYTFFPVSGKRTQNPRRIVAPKRLAADFSLMMVPGIFFYTNFLVLLRFLQNIDCMYVPTLMVLIVNGVNFGIQYVALFVFNAGYLAAAVTVSFSYGLLFFAELTYFLVFKKYDGVWDGFRREALSEWGEFSWLALCGVGHYGFEVFCLNAGVILSGTINSTFLAAQSILNQFEAALYMIPNAVSVAVNIRTGQSLGKGDVAGAKLCIRTSLIIVALFVTCLSILLLGTQNYIPWLFTTHRNIVDETARTMPMMVLVVVLDCFRGVVDGAIRGCGRQFLGAISLFFSSALIGLPIGIPLLFTSLRLIGFWTGISVALIFSITLSSIILWCQNWEREAVKAQHRVLFANKQAGTAGGKSEKTPLLPSSVAKIRTPREPRSCSTNFEVMREHPNISDDEFWRLLIKRCLIYAFCVLLFVGSVVTNLVIPHELYLSIGGNNTVNASHFS